MQKVKLIAHTPNPDKVVTMAAKLCYSPIGVEEMSEKITDEEIEKFLNMLVSLGHESPIEHVSFTFAIENVSRILEIQLVRSRIASYSIQSGRYVNRENPDFIVPESIKNNKEAMKKYEDICQKSKDAYNDIFVHLIAEKIRVNPIYEYDKILEFKENNKKLYSKYEKECIEDARYAHLQSLSTKIIVTMNARSLFNFFNHRCCERAQTEIRELAYEMLEECKKVAPILFKNCGAPCVTKSCPEGKMSCGNPKGKNNGKMR